MFWDLPDIRLNIRRLRFGLDAKGLGQTHLNLTLNLIGGVYQSGALFSYDGRPKQVNIRVGVSFISAEQACANAESEVGSASFEDILGRAKALWQEKLSKVEIDLARTPANVTEMLYSSLYRAALTPVCCHLFFFEIFVSCSYRIMPPAKHKVSLRIRHHSISIHCIAGTLNSYRSTSSTYISPSLVGILLVAWLFR